MRVSDLKLFFEQVQAETLAYEFLPLVVVTVDVILVGWLIEIVRVSGASGIGPGLISGL